MATPEERFDIDLGALGRSLVRNWLLILALMILGALVAVAVVLASGTRYAAASAVYLGQPTDINGNAISGINSNPRGAEQIVLSGAVVREAAQRVGGISAARLRDEIEVDSPTVTVRTLSAPTNFVTITVRDPKPEKAVAAANALADLLRRRVSRYAREKIALLRKQIDSDSRRLGGLDTRIRRAQDALGNIATGGGTAAQRATASAPYLAILEISSSLRDQLLARIQSRELSLIVAEDVERPEVFSRASAPARRVTPGLVLAIGSGLVAGLIVGIVVAPVRDRLRRKSA